MANPSLPSGITVESFLRYIRGTRGHAHRVIHGYAVDQTDQLTRYLEVVLALADVLLETTSHLTSKGRLKQWLVGDTPNAQRSYQRFQVVAAAFMDLHDFGEESDRQRTALELVDWVNDQYGRSVISRVDPITLAYKPAKDLEDPDTWASVVA